MHELAEAEEAVAAVNAGDFVVVLDGVGDDGGVPDEEGDGLAYVYALLDGGEVVWEHGDGDGFAPRAYLIIYGCYETAVEVLDGAELQVEVAVVACFVAGFDVYEDEVVGAECVECGLGFAFVVGVGESGGSGDFDDA